MNTYNIVFWEEMTGYFHLNPNVSVLSRLTSLLKHMNYAM